MQKEQGEIMLVQAPRDLAQSKEGVCCFTSVVEYDLVQADIDDGQRCAHYRLQDACCAIGRRYNR
jgi:hypothetical protein